MNGRDTHRLYVNVQLANPANATALQPASFTCNLIEGAGIAPMASFDATVARFFLPLSSLPYFDSSKQQFFVTLTYNGVDYKQQVNVISYATGDPNVYYVQQWIDSINAALNQAYAALVAAITPTAQFWPNRAPFLQFNSATNLISLVTDAGSWENTAPGSPIIWFNTPLALQLRNLPQRQLAYNSVSGKDSQVVILTRGATPIANPGPTLESTQISGLVPFCGYAGGTMATTFTSIALAANGASTMALPTGTKIVLANPSNIGIPSFFYVFTLSASVAIGALSLPVVSYTQPGSPFAPGIGVPLYVLPPTQLITQEEAPSVLNWWTTTRICLVSTLLSARNELNTFPELGPIGAGQSGLLKPQNILADYVITPSDRLQGNTTLVMIPQPNFRWFDLMSEDDFKIADFAFYATDDVGPQPQNLQLINFEPGQGGGIKLLFSKHTITSRALNYEKTKALNGGDLFAKMKAKRRRVL